MQSVDEKLSRAGYAPAEFGQLFGKSRSNMGLRADAF